MRRSDWLVRTDFKRFKVLEPCWGRLLPRLCRWARNKRIDRVGEENPGGLPACSLDLGSCHRRQLLAGPPSVVESNRGPLRPDAIKPNGRLIDREEAQKELRNVVVALVTRHAVRRPG